MPHEPKRRHSKERKGERRASIKLTVAKIATCQNCGAKHPFHTVCAQCGFYKGMSYLKKQDRTTKEQAA